jgi:hypothetical protein
MLFYWKDDIFARWVSWSAPYRLAGDCLIPQIYQVQVFCNLKFHMNIDSLKLKVQCHINCIISTFFWHYAIYLFSHAYGSYTDTTQLSRWRRLLHTSVQDHLYSFFMS